MPTDQRNPPEQERSIKERRKEFFVPVERKEPTTTVKPFAVYLRETPATPLSAGVKTLLWAIGIVVLILFAAAIWRSQKVSRRKPSTQTSAAVTRWPEAHARLAVAVGRELSV